MAKNKGALQVTEPRALAVGGRRSASLAEDAENKLLSLNRRIELLFDRPHGRIVDFVGAQPGGDSSKLVFEFAKLTARRLNRRVLLLLAGPVRYPHPNGTSPWTERWDRIVTESGAIDECIQRLGDLSVWYSQMSGALMDLPAILHDPRFEILLTSFRTRFDLILMDSPSLGESSSAVRLSSASDGVVLVVEAGKTRWQVIRNQVREIQVNRGTVLGVVLNKRKYPIPEFIYKRL